MEIKYLDPATGKEKTINITEFRIEEAKDQLKPVLSKSQLKRQIDSNFKKGEIKSILESISDHTVNFGEWTFKIGHKAVELAISFIKRYPNTAAGLLIGAVIGLILSSIPVIGWIIGWLVMPLFTVLGLGVGCWMDLKDKELQSSIKDEVMQLFGTFKDIKLAA
jgi:hypothetical protein